MARNSPFVGTGPDRTADTTPAMVRQSVPVDGPSPGDQLAIGKVNPLPNYYRALDGRYWLAAASVGAAGWLALWWLL